MREVGLEDKMLQHGIPMYARMIHNIDGTRNVIPYDKVNNQAIYSVGRKYLNEILLTGSEDLLNFIILLILNFRG